MFYLISTDGDDLSYHQMEVVITSLIIINTGKEGKDKSTIYRPFQTVHMPLYPSGTFNLLMFELFVDLGLEEQAVVVNLSSVNMTTIGGEGEGKERSLDMGLSFDCFFGWLIDWLIDWLIVDWLFDFFKKHFVHSQNLQNYINFLLQKTGR